MLMNDDKKVVFLKKKESKRLFCQPQTLQLVIKRLVIGLKQPAFNDSNWCGLWLILWLFRFHVHWF